MIVAIFERKRLKLSTAILPAALLSFLGISLLPKIITNVNHKQLHNPSLQTCFERESMYGWVLVIDNLTLNLRLLTADASTIGAAGLSHGENVLTYQRSVGSIPALVPNMSKALLIGQGTGHMVTNLKYHGIKTDTIEIDPKLFRFCSYW